MEANQREWEKHRRAINESEAVQLLMEEILLEVITNSLLFFSKRR
jgi:hypothetical protein